MNTGLVGMAIEIAIVALLSATIYYCIKLNGRLKRLKADEKALVTTIGELIAATAAAERAIGGLKLTIRESEQTLERRLSEAETFDGVLAAQIGKGERVLVQLQSLQGLSALADAAATLRQHQASAPARAQPAAAPVAAQTIEPAAAAPVTESAESLSATALAAQSFAERARTRLTRRAA